MPEQLPETRFLDMAAKAANFPNWEGASGRFGYPIGHTTTNSIIAHARTLERLAKHEPDIVPVDEDRAAARRIYNAGLGERGIDRDVLDRMTAQFKAELAGRK